MIFPLKILHFRYTVRLVLSPIVTKVSKFVLLKSFDEPSNVADKPSKVKS